MVIIVCVDKSALLLVLDVAPLSEENGGTSRSVKLSDPFLALRQAVDCRASDTTMEAWSKRDVSAHVLA